MTSMPFTVLFLNAGRRCELVEGFREALSRRVEFRILGSDISPLAPALQVVDEAILLAGGDTAAFADQLLDLCAEREVDLVIPTIDPDLERLDALRERFAQEVPRTRVLLSPRETIRLARDKRLSRERFAAAGLDVPRAVDPRSDADFPVFVKPPDGSASEGARRISSSRELAVALAERADLIIEEVVSGDEFTVDTLCDFAGAPLLAVCRRRLKTRGGEVLQGVVAQRADVVDAARRAAVAFAATGPVTVQFRVSPERIVAMEINARLGGGLPLAIAAGADWPGLIVDMCLGNPLTLPTRIEDGLFMTRSDRSYFLRREDLDALEEARRPLLRSRQE